MTGDSFLPDIDEDEIERSISEINEAIRRRIGRSRAPADVVGPGQASPRTIHSRRAATGPLLHFPFPGSPMTFLRTQDRAADQLRPVRITRSYTVHAEGSVLVEFGDTRVLCTASRRGARAAASCKGKGEGWVTAEYGMLPRATHTRCDREAARGKQSGPHAGDPAPDRPLAARRVRPGSAGRTHDHARLRRAAGRRRHAHRGHHRRVASPRTTPWRSCWPRGKLARSPLRGSSPRCRWASSRARRCSTSSTSRTRPATPT